MANFVPPKPAALQDDFPQLEILDLIGHGGMGAVYKARQRGLDRPVALKVLPPQAASDPAFAERFAREARAMARLNHPNVVTVYDSGRAGQYYYLVMEYIDGVNLREALRTGHLSSSEALGIVPQICDALQYAHDQGVVHRDIKPENVLLDRDGRIKVVDFGLAKLLGAAPDFTLTGSHQVLGTPRYMAPEQMEGRGTIDHRADIYSLGVVFYELLTGELPLGRFAPPSQKVQVDVRLDEIVLRTLDKEPDRRYQHASDLKTDVESLSVPRHAHYATGYEYRSKGQLFGLPWVHIAKGVDPTTGHRRVAKGVIAIGDMAIGGIALGGSAVGGIAIGGFAVGLMTLGGFSLGLWLALGGAAIGLGVSAGGLAIGSVAFGGWAIGVYAFGGGALGVHAYGGNIQDPRALDVFNNTGRVALRILWIEIPATVVTLGMVLVAMAFRKKSARSRADHHEPAAYRHSHSQSRTASGVAVGCLLALGFVGMLLCGGVIAGSYVWMSKRIPQNANFVVWAINDQGKPEVGVDLAAQLQLNELQADTFNSILQESHDTFLALKAQHTEQTTDADGRVVITTEPLNKEVDELVNQLWLRLDEILDVQQQSIARSSLPLGQGTGNDLFRSGLDPETITLWRVGSWYHWDVRSQSYHYTDSGPVLPPELSRYWPE